MKQKNKQKVAVLNNDHVRTKEAEAARVKMRKVRLVRRLSVLAILSLLVFGSLTVILISKNATLQEKQEEKEAALQQLAEVKEQQAMLKTQIKKLKDDEYIAKLLRKEYFLSEQGEIIFIIPEEDEAKK